MKDPVARWVACIAAVIHLAVAGRYDLFRDELYFIVCGRHPAFGYADQPPLVPLLAAAGFAFGQHTWAVRLVVVAAAAALPLVVVAFVRLLGGGDRAAWLAGLTAALAPMFAGLTATLNTTSFEPLAWTAIAYLLARVALRDDRRAALWAGLVAGIALEAKYAIVLWMIALGAGLLLGSERRVLARRELWLGAALAALLAAPSLVWQALHGWPFVELVHNAHLKDEAVAPLSFALNQVLVYGPLVAPVWIAGIIAPFFFASMRGARFVSIAYLVCAIAIVAGQGKDYYLAPAVPSLAACGAVALERALRTRWLNVYTVVTALAALPLLPLALPILPPDRIVAYERMLHVAPQAQEKGDASGAIPPVFADMLGWHDFVREVASAYEKIPAPERARTALLVDNYGEAAALDIYGAPYHLPRALSGHNQYFFWGPVPDAQAVDLLRVADDPEDVRPSCGSLTILDTTHAAYARRFETGKIIGFCRNVHPPLSKLWPGLEKLI